MSVRKLPSVVTLGAVDLVCSDKTVTLTCNLITVKQCYVSVSYTHLHKRTIPHTIPLPGIPPPDKQNCMGYGSFVRTGKPTPCSVHPLSCAIHRQRCPTHCHNHSDKQSLRYNPPLQPHRCYAVLQQSPSPRQASGYPCCHNPESHASKFQSQYLSLIHILLPFFHVVSPHLSYCS